jgi:hypothetical protein
MGYYIHGTAHIIAHALPVAAKGLTVFLKTVLDRVINEGYI